MTPISIVADFAKLLAILGSLSIVGITLKILLGGQMQGREYRGNVRGIVRNVIRKKAPGIKRSVLDEIATEISAAVHARFYGASVDNVASPIWRDDPNYARAFADNKPTKDAQQILNEGMND